MARFEVELKSNRAELQIEIDDRTVLLALMADNPGQIDRQGRSAHTAPHADHGYRIPDGFVLYRMQSGSRPGISVQGRRDGFPADRFDEIVADTELNQAPPSWRMAIGQRSSVTA